jgi:PilZ domain
VSNAIRALLVTTDARLDEQFMAITREIGIDAQATARKEGIPEELTRAKYEAILLDFDTIPEAMAILSTVRESPANKNAVVFAVATDVPQGRKALECGANLRFERPLDVKQIRRGIYAAYDSMVRERRRYFRCTVELPVLIVQASSGADLRCTSMNISSSGIALRTPSVLKTGEEVQIILSLPETDLPVRAIGTVVWDDKHGKSGISFKCASPQHQSDLDSWLDTQLRTLLGSEPPRPGISN